MGVVKLWSEMEHTMISINLNDNCRVQLTEAGAKYMNALNKEANRFINEMFVKPVLLYHEYTTGEYFCSNLLFVTEIYLKTRELGFEEPFLSGTIEVLTN